MALFFREPRSRVESSFDRGWGPKNFASLPLTKLHSFTEGGAFSLILLLLLYIIYNTEASLKGSLKLHLCGLRASLGGFSFRDLEIASDSE